MFNFWEAFTYIFKEKNWEYKFLLPFVLQLLIVVPGMLLGSSQSVQTTTYLNTGVMTRTTPVGVFGFFYLCLFLISFIPYLVVTIWYMYENTQSGIFKRDTKPIWKNHLNDTLKKVSKYVLTNLLYNLVVFLVLFVVLGFACVIVAAVGILIVAITNSGTMPSDLTTVLTSGVGLFFICLFSFAVLILYIFVYMWMTTGSLKLIATNTFEEGINFGANWKLAMKHKWKFVELLLVVFLGTILIGMFSGMISLATTILSSGIPFLNFIFELVLQIGLSLVVTYLGFFVYPRLLGQMFRKIVQEDKSLNYIKL